MPTDTESKSCVEAISLAQEVDQRVAHATLHLGEVTIRGVAVWRSRNGKLSVFFPRYKYGAGWDDVIELAADLRSQVEADVIASYKAAKSAAVKRADKTERN